MFDGEKMLAKFTDIKKIGEGTYGTVYRAKSLKDNMLVALKKIHLTRGDDGVPSTCIREIFILKELSHPNVIKILDIIIHKEQRLYIVFEYIDQDLKIFLEKISPRPVPIFLVKSFIFQLLQALAYCHAHRIMHRDLKPQNILVSNTGLIKLADFGSYSMPSRCYTHEVLTLWYRAPEILLGSCFYSPSVDMWSLACIFAEIIIGKALFPGDSEIDQLFCIFKILGTPNSSVWSEVENLPAFKNIFPKWKQAKLQSIIPGLSDDGIDLLEKLFCYSPLRRMSAKKALSHRYFWDVTFNFLSFQSFFSNN